MNNREKENPDYLDKLEVELTNHANEVFEPELTNDVDQILEEPKKRIQNFQNLMNTDVKDFFDTVQNRNLVKNKNTKKHRHFKKQQKKEIYLQLENFEYIDIDKDKVLSGFLLPHEKDMILSDLEKTNFKISYDHVSLNFMPAIPLEQKDIEKISTLIHLRNKESYLDFELYHSDSVDTDLNRKEMTELFKVTKKLKHKINKKAKKLSAFQKSFVKGDKYQSLRNFQKNKPHIYYDQTMVLKAIKSLLKRRFDINIEYIFEDERFVITTEDYDFFIDLEISIDNDIGAAGGLAHYTKNDRERRVEIIKPYSYEGFLYGDIETLLHEIGHCIHSFSDLFPECFETFCSFNLFDGIEIDKEQEIVSVFFEYLMFDDTFLKDIDFPSQYFETTLLGNYYHIMLNCYFTGNILRSQLRKQNRLQHRVEESNFAHVYLNNHSFHALLKFHENYRNFRMVDWYFYGHYNALKKLKKHFPDIYSHFK